MAGRITLGSKTITKPFAHGGKQITKITRDRDGKALSLILPPLRYGAVSGGVLKHGSETLATAYAVQIVVDGTTRPRTITIMGIPHVYSYHERDTHYDNPGSAKRAFSNNLPFKPGYNTIELQAWNKPTDLTHAGGISTGTSTFKKVGSDVYIGGRRLTSSWYKYYTWTVRSIWTQHWVRLASDGSLEIRIGGGTNARYGVSMIPVVTYKNT